MQQAGTRIFWFRWQLKKENDLLKHYLKQKFLTLCQAWCTLEQLLSIKPSRRRCPWAAQLHGSVLSSAWAGCSTTRLRTDYHLRCRVRSRVHLRGSAPCRSCPRGTGASATRPAGGETCSVPPRVSGFPHEAGTCHQDGINQQFPTQNELPRR